MAAQNFFPIVVAIIAVLVAIAVPLFVGSLEDAKKKTFEANQRAVKGAAEAAILGAPSGDEWNISEIFNSDTIKFALVDATITNGDITLNSITGSANDDDATEYADFDETDGNIKVAIPKINLSSSAAGG